MDESTILDALELISNRVDTITALMLATFMLIVAILVYLCFHKGG